MRHVLTIVVQVAVWSSDRFDALMLGLIKDRPGVFERVNFRRWATVQIFAYFSALGQWPGIRQNLKASMTSGLVSPEAVWHNEASCAPPLCCLEQGHLVAPCPLHCFT